MPADDTTLLSWLAALPGPVTVAMEATLYWAWLHDQLTTAGYPAVAVHPYQVKLIWQARCKTDPIDARKLADLGRSQLLPTIWVADARPLPSYTSASLRSSTPSCLGTCFILAGSGT